MKAGCILHGAYTVLLYILGKPNSSNANNPRGELSDDEGNASTANKINDSVQSEDPGKDHLILKYEINF